MSNGYDYNRDSDEDSGKKSKVEEGDRAVASGTLQLNDTAYSAFISGSLEGSSEAWSVARLSGIQGAKKADELILVSYSYNIRRIEMDYETDEEVKSVTVTCSVRIAERIGAETAALVGCGTALMALADKLSVVDRKVRITDLHVEQ